MTPTRPNKFPSVSISFQKFLPAALLVILGVVGKNKKPAFVKMENGGLDIIKPAYRKLSPRGVFEGVINQTSKNRHDYETNYNEYVYQIHRRNLFFTGFDGDKSKQYTNNSGKDKCDKYTLVELFSNHAASSCADCDFDSESIPRNHYRKVGSACQLCSESFNSNK